MKKLKKPNGCTDLITFKKLSNLIAFFAAFIIFGVIGKSTQCYGQPDTTITVPLGGNAWKIGESAGGELTNDGIAKWTNQRVSFTAYVRFANEGKFKLWLNLQVPDGQSRISISALNSVREIDITGSVHKDFYAGEWNVTDTGYVAFEIKAISKTGSQFADVSSMKLSGTAITNKNAYVPNNEGEFFYWGRRGPSVHLNYTMPVGTNAEWFYNEVTVPKGNDVLGSYFMADGFAEGYFGMQVNSPTERHILFSVWSPYKTDNPGQIPDDQKIIMLKKVKACTPANLGMKVRAGKVICCIIGKPAIPINF